MSFSQSELDDLAQRYTDAWNSKVPEQVAAFHRPNSSIVINRGEPSKGLLVSQQWLQGFTLTCRTCI